MTIETLWGLVRHCFEFDDGSLPTVELQHLKSAELADVYRAIRRGSRVVSESPSFWDFHSQTDRSLDDTENAALLVATGQAAPFHFALEGLSANGVQLPCLGLHIFQETVALDYRMGPDWGPEQVFTFFSLLDNMAKKTAKGVVVPSAEEFPDASSFALAWRLFRT